MLSIGEYLIESKVISGVIETKVGVVSPVSKIVGVLSFVSTFGADPLFNFIFKKYMEDGIIIQIVINIYTISCGISFLLNYNCIGN